MTRLSDDLIATFQKKWDTKSVSTYVYAERTKLVLNDIYVLYNISYKRQSGTIYRRFNVEHYPASTSPYLHWSKRDGVTSYYRLQLSTNTWELNKALQFK
jgi:hypothetical protein